MQSTLRSAVLGLALLFAPAAAAAPADFSGTWVLDQSASDSPEPLLKAQGASLVERKVASGMDVTQSITQSGDKLDIAIDTSVKDSEQSVIVDGVTRDVTDEKGRPAKVSNSWVGSAWVTVSESVDKSGTSMTVTLTRTLSDGGKTMTQRIEMAKGSDATLAIDRVFRKK